MDEDNLGGRQHRPSATQAEDTACGQTHLDTVLWAKQPVPRPSERERHVCTAIEDVFGIDNPATALLGETGEAGVND